MDKEIFSDKESFEIAKLYGLNADEVRQIEYEVLRKIDCSSTGKIYEVASD